MKEQSIFDNREFFEGYRELRSKEINYNNCIEQPAMSALLPDLREKSVLDLGCGYGYNCTDFIRRGAKRVVGIDISEKMLSIAKEKSSHPKIEFKHLSMTEISSLNEKFDLAYSSLAFHYIEDFKKLSEDIFNLLNKGGCLLFSQEHPFVTASPKLCGFNRDSDGNKVSFTFTDYSTSGSREENWFNVDFVKFHRTVGDIFTALAESGFVIKKVCEPMPDSEAVKKCPSMSKEYIRPNFLIVKAEKM